VDRYGLWLSTSFHHGLRRGGTSRGFIDGTGRRRPSPAFPCVRLRLLLDARVPVVRLHVGPRTFPDPEGMLARLKAEGLRIWCGSTRTSPSARHCSTRPAAAGYLLKTTSGMCGSGTCGSPHGHRRLHQPRRGDVVPEKAEVLLDQGVDAFKTDFGERIRPRMWSGSTGPTPSGSQLLCAPDTTRPSTISSPRRGGRSGAVLAVGHGRRPQQFVHWGGDCDSTYASMAETFAEGCRSRCRASATGATTSAASRARRPPGLQRWLPFGLCRATPGCRFRLLPGAVGVRRRGGRRHRLRFDPISSCRVGTPYLARLAEEAASEGVPLMRPGIGWSPRGSRAPGTLEAQSMSGTRCGTSRRSSECGVADTYLRAAGWRHLLDGRGALGRSGTSRTYRFDSLGLYVRPGTVLPVGARGRTPRSTRGQRGSPCVRSTCPTVRLLSSTSRAVPESRRRSTSGGTAHVDTATSDDARGHWTLDVVGGGSATASGAAKVSVAVSGD